MKYYSEKLSTIFDTIEELEAAEIEAMLENEKVLDIETLIKSFEEATAAMKSFVEVGTEYFNKYKALPNDVLYDKEEDSEGEELSALVALLKLLV